MGVYYVPMSSLTSSTEFTASPESRPAHAEEHEHGGIEWLEYARIAFVGVAILVTWFQVWRPFPRWDIVGLIATLVGGYPIFREAAADVMKRRMTMELSMTIALLAALIIGEVFTALVIVFFVLIAEVLEEMTVGRGRQAIHDLLRFLPTSTEIRSGEGVRTLDISEVRTGDVVLVRPGARVPVDGDVVSGHSFVDQASITGESLPVEKTPGASVYAGTINQSGFLEVRTTLVGKDTAFGRIIEAVERAEQLQAPVQKLADRLAGYLVYFALACAVLTFALTRNPRSTISVIIVAGACGIAAGTPLAILGAIGRAARRGAIVKGGRYLETLSHVNTVVLDKTGTLTLGRPEVRGVQPAPDVTEHDLVQAAASAERFSEHPLGKAILEKAAALRIPTSDPSGFRYTPGKGIACELNGIPTLVGTRALLLESGVELPPDGEDSGTHSTVFVARNGRYLGKIQIADVLRSGSAEAVARLREMNIRTVLLTGDAAVIAQKVGQELGVDAVEADLLPEMKLERIESLRRQGYVVAMVGDGVNDAPALMAANVGIAMGSGTDVARESAAVVLLGDDLTKLTQLLDISRHCYRIIMTNFAGTLAVDAAGVGLAAFGFLSPVLAALIHVTSEMVFILNSARLLSGGTGNAAEAVPFPSTQAEAALTSAAGRE